MSTHNRSYPERVRFEKQAVVIGDASSGVEVRYVKASRTLRFFGWYDHIAGIEGATIGLCDFLDALGVTQADLEKARRD